MTQESESQITLGRLACDALVTHKGNKDKAVSYLVSKLRKDRTLLRSVVKEAIIAAVVVKVQDGIHQVRERILCAIPPIKSPEEQRASVVALATGIAGSGLLDTPLASGIKLRDADHDALSHQIDRYEVPAATMLLRARWLRLIMQELPQGKRVGQSLSEERIRHLLERARHAKTQMLEAAE